MVWCGVVVSFCSVVMWCGVVWWCRFVVWLCGVVVWCGVVWWCGVLLCCIVCIVCIVLYCITFDAVVARFVTLLRLRSISLIASSCGLLSVGWKS